MGLLNIFKKPTPAGDTSKPNIMIQLPIFHLMTGKEPFADMTEDYDDPKLNMISVYAALYKVYCYNMLLVGKIGKDIYAPMIFEKQREKLAVNDLGLSEEYTVLMRMIQELDQMHAKDPDPESGLEGLIAYAMINKEKEFADVKELEIARAEWMMKIAGVLKDYKAGITEFFENVAWRNSGFTAAEFDAWQTKI